MGFFDKLKSGLAKTKNAVFSQVDSILKSFVKVDEDLLEELEEALICSDMGMECAEKVIDELRDAVREGRLKEPEEVKAALKDILRGMIGEGEPLKLDTKPSVILVIGVNGVGKTTSIAKIAHRLKENGKHVIGLGMKGSTSELLRDNCDEFIYYEDLERYEEDEAQTVTKIDAGLPERKKEAFTLLIEACKALGETTILVNIVQARKF